MQGTKKESPETYTGLDLKDSFDLNVIVFSIFASLSGIGVFFWVEDLGKMFVYSMFSIGMVAFLTNFTVRCFADKIEQMSQEGNCRKFWDRDWSAFTLFCSGLATGIWSLAILYIFGGFSAWQWVVNVIFGFILLFSLLSIFASFNKEEKVKYLHLQ